MIQLVSATRYSRQQFMQRCLLGLCLPRIGQYQPVGLNLYADNSQPLGFCYNQKIEQADPDDVLVFVHDDVFIEDWMLAIRLFEALERFDVVGVAGNRRLQPGQQAWHLLPGAVSSRATPKWDAEQLSGAVGHGSSPGQANLTVFGPSPQAVMVLDGVFLAARAAVLQQSGVRFDAELGFHFYDLDFCRTASEAGLRLGTWPIAITHQSSGESIFSNAWATSLQKYQQKWETE